MGLVSELAYDDRGDSAATPFENDIMFGLRLAVNDPASSELLAGFLQDLTSSARTLNYEGSRRFGNHWKTIVEASIFINSPEDGHFYSLRAATKKTTFDKTKGGDSDNSCWQNLCL